LLVEGESPQGRRAVLLDTRLAVAAPAPARDGEAAGATEELDHLVVGRRVAEGSPLAFVTGLAEEGGLDLGEQLDRRGGQPCERQLLLLAGVAAREGGRSGRDVAGAELDAQRHALELPLVELEAGPVLLAIVQTNANPGSAQLIGDGGGSFDRRRPVVLAEDR